MNKGVLATDISACFMFFYDSYNVYVLTPSEVIRILTFSFLELTSNPIVVLSFFLYLMFLHLGKGFVLKRVSLAIVIYIDILMKPTPSALVFEWIKNVFCMYITQMW